MSWTNDSLISSVWVEPSGIEANPIDFDEALPFDADYLTFDGGFYMVEIDWLQGVSRVTVWS